jgi:hypothetical protein
VHPDGWIRRVARNCGAQITNPVWTPAAIRPLDRDSSSSFSLSRIGDRAINLKHCFFWAYLLVTMLQTAFVATQRLTNPFDGRHATPGLDAHFLSI